MNEVHLKKTTFTTTQLTQFKKDLAVSFHMLLPKKMHLTT